MNGFRTITEDTRFASFIGAPVTREAAILEVLDKGPATAREIAHALGFTERNAVAPRLTELAERGLVKAVGKKPCTVTGKTVAVFERVNPHA